MLRRIKNSLLFLFLSQVAFAQSTSNDSIKNFIDPATGLKQGYWIVFNDVKKLPNYRSDAKVEEGRFIDGKKIGLWKVYHPSGNIKSEITYTNNRPNGYAKIYYENGTIQEEGSWENNRWVGGYKAYHDNGQVFYDFKYTENGKRQGEQKYFYENGQLMMKGEMQYGKETGVWEERYENGDIRAKKAFNNGALDIEKTEVYAPKKPLPQKVETIAEPPKIVDAAKEKTNAALKPFNGTGYAKLFLSGAKISKDGEFKNYRLIDGKDYIYNGDGILEKVAVYKGGKYIGDAPIEDKDR